MSEHQAHETDADVVVGVDDTPAADWALAWAASLAGGRGCGITVLHAARSLTTGFATQLGPEHGSTVASLRAEGRQVTVRAARTLREAGFRGPVHERLVPGRPAESLVAASADASLVVVGARDPGLLGALVHGSVRRALVSHGHCPVVAVPNPEAHPGGLGVLVAVDADRPQDAPLDLAYRMAADLGTRLTVLGCVLTPGGVYAGPGQADAQNPQVEQERRVLQDLVAGRSAMAPTVSTRVEVDQGPVDAAVVWAARDHDLLVLGAHTHSRVARLLVRDVDRWVVGHAPCPVAVVPPGSSGR